MDTVQHRRLIVTRLAFLEQRLVGGVVNRFTDFVLAFRVLDQRHKMTQGRTSR